MNIILATDHAGFELKEEIKNWLSQHNYIPIDVGAFELVPDDNYPEYMQAAVRELTKASGDARAIVFGGSGTGEAIVCNRFSSLRAVVYNGQSLEVVRLGRAHNDANILSIGARFVTLEQTIEAVQVFLGEAFEGGRHIDRLAQIDNHNVVSN